MIAEQIETRWLVRGQKFFRTMSRNGKVRGALLARGLTNQELKRGWDLFAKAVAPLNGSSPAASPPLGAAEALAWIETWDAPNYAAAQATLEHHAPKARAFLMQGLVATKGPQAVVGVRLFMDRVAALRDGMVSGVTAEEGSDAVRLLAERKIFDAETEVQLEAYLSLIEGGAEPEAAPDFASMTSRFEAYRKWLNEWREVARATFNQRHILISLGLASRRQGENEDADLATPAVEPAPVSVH
jgi:hypothetical protein